MNRGANNGEEEEDDAEEGQEAFDDPMVWNSEFEWPKKEVKKFTV